ncbi:MAG: Aha1 domain superfamily [Candidatus Taylorbacteria bacterium]|nr:Aha1 domain superfamily [Candidatus Taylorbacteria bacterium]
MQDSITCEIIVKANKERVYTAITDPKEITTWFPNVVEGATLEVGERPIFIFTEENHKTQIYVEAAKPYEYFSYRWVPGSAGIVGDVLTVPNTLVEFFIEEQEDGTKVTVKESGFASLPPEVAEKSFKQNSGGWKYMIGRLEEVMNK